jgi:hypothetical protein
VPGCGSVEQKINSIFVNNKKATRERLQTLPLRLASLSRLRVRASGALHQKLPRPVRPVHGPGVEDQGVAFAARVAVHAAGALVVVGGRREQRQREAAVAHCGVHEVVAVPAAATKEAGANTGGRLESCAAEGDIE